MKMNKPNTEERFWSKVNKTESIDDCWEWNAAIGSDGYGVFHWNFIKPEDRAPSGVRSKLIKAHRASLMLQGLEVPAYTGKSNGLEILHECDNKRCVNPHHLKIGTHSKNLKDYFSRGRYRNAEKQTSA